jgi:hypothetical protein
MGQRTIVLVAFVVITVLTALAVLGAALGLFPGANEKLITWGIPAVLGEIVASIVLFFKAQMVPHEIKINLDFDGQEPVNFDGPNCEYFVFDHRGKEVERDSVGLNHGPGGWQVQLGQPVLPDHSVSVSLTTDNGDKWAIRPFRPDVHTQKPIRV